MLDTNVVVAAGFDPDSASARLLDAVRRGEVRLVWNDATREETEYIVRKIPPLSWHSVADLYRPENRFGEPTDPDAFQVVADPSDRKFLALAAASGAVLISMDEHLLGVRDQVEVPILTPGEYLRKYQA